jgi:hypothetical protein
MLPAVLLDVAGTTHRIGEAFTGFIWSVCVRNRVEGVTFAVETGECIGDFCANCPVGECLVNCDLDQTMADFDAQPATCVSCSDECTSGCIRTTDCRVCKDDATDLCAECSDKYEVCDASGCIEGAENSGDICICSGSLIYLVGDDKCGGCVIGCKTCTNDITCDECFDEWFKTEEKL